MSVIARRSMLAAAGVAAAATLATVVTLRKPGPRVLTLTPDSAPPPVHLQSLAAALHPIDPPLALGDVRFADANGATHSLRDYAGKGVVLNLWATWCAPCVAEMPSLARLAQAAAAQGLVVLPVSTDRGGAAQVRHFYRTHGIAGLPVLVDPTGTLTETLHVRGLPTTLLIDATGHARAKLEGGADWAAPDALAVLRKAIG